MYKLLLCDDAYICLLSCSINATFTRNLGCVQKCKVTASDFFFFFFFFFLSWIPVPNDERQQEQGPGQNTREYLALLNAARVAWLRSKVQIT